MISKRFQTFLVECEPPTNFIFEDMEISTQILDPLKEKNLNVESQDSIYILIGCCLDGWLMLFAGQGLEKRKKEFWTNRKALLHFFALPRTRVAIARQCRETLPAPQATRPQADETAKIVPRSFSKNGARAYRSTSSL